VHRATLGFYEFTLVVSNCLLGVVHTGSIPWFCGLVAET